MKRILFPLILLIVLGVTACGPQGIQIVPPGPGGARATVLPTDKPAVQPTDVPSVTPVIRLATETPLPTATNTLPPTATLPPTLSPATLTPVTTPTRVVLLSTATPTSTRTSVPPSPTRMVTNTPVPVPTTRATVSPPAPGNGGIEFFAPQLSTGSLSLSVETFGILAIGSMTLMIGSLMVGLLLFVMRKK